MIKIWPRQEYYYFFHLLLFALYCRSRTCYFSLGRKNLDLKFLGSQNLNRNENQNCNSRPSFMTTIGSHLNYFNSQHLYHVVLHQLLEWSI